MLVTTTELAQFSGVHPDENSTLPTIYINSAAQIIADYVGFNPEENEEWKNQSGVVIVPDIFKLVCLEIATLIQAEEGTNLGVNTSSEIGVSRSYLNVVDYTKYLQRLSIFRKGFTVAM